MLERNNERGQLPPVVLIHGLSSAGVHYLRVTPHLRAFSRVVLPDLPGHGFSQMPPRLSGDNLLEGTYESLDAAIDEPAIIAGTSLGGYVAMRYAMARPHKVRALMVAAPAGASMSTEDLSALRARFDLKTHRQAVAFVDALFARPQFFRHVVAMGLRKYFSLPQTLAVLEELRASHLFTPAQLSELAMPMLFLWGDAERILPPSNLEFFRTHLPPHAQVELTAGWGHSGFLDDPRGFASRLTMFAAEASRRPVPISWHGPRPDPRTSQHQAPPRTG
jgi:pimeloyl-ACP methyl ester carboxylesterase